MIKRFKTFFLLFIILGAPFFLITYWLTPRMIVQVQPPIVGTEVKPLKDLFFRYNKGHYFNWYSEDQLKLEGFISDRPTLCKGTIILLHGIRSRKESFLSLGKWLFDHGYQFVAIDLRGHGMSEGTYCSFGYHEKKDIHLLIDELEKKGCSRIGVFGQSLGGAIGLQAMAYDHRIKFGIIESTFYNFKAVCTHYFSRLTGISTQSFITQKIFPFCIDKASELAGFPSDSVNPSHYCNQIESPVLLAHGKRDQRIPLFHAQKNAKKIKNVTHLEINEAGHLNLHQIGGKEYLNVILEFLNKSSTR